MYTRCPECQTAFRVTIAQLKARDGLVRCGRCEAIFRADLRLFAPADSRSASDAADTETQMFIDLAPDQADARLRADIPVVSDLSLLLPRRKWTSALWFVAAVALSVLWVGQFAYFYRDELAELPELRPALIRACLLLQCEIAATTATVPELLQTSIAPHPRYANALRIRANLVNRTDQPLAYPLVQVSITDSAGGLLARRAFAPREYLTAGSAASALAPNELAQALLDVTNPDNKAAGSEVQLFRQRSKRTN
jgi:predicted Zn finger-like uncharacterized protein